MSMAPVCRNRFLAPAALVASALGTLPAGAAPPSSPLEPPEYSIDRASPLVHESSLQAGDLLERGFLRPRVALEARGLLLFSPFDDVDALSGPHLEFAHGDTVSILFSVDRATVGLSPPDPVFVASGVPYNVRDQAQRGHAAGDTFLAADLFDRAGPLMLEENARQNNLLGLNNFDEGGSDLVVGPPTHASTWLAPGTPIDRVDALAHLPRDDRGDIAAAYFSLTSSSPALERLGGTGADVFVAFVVREGACCLDDHCAVTTRPACQAAGGVWLGPGSSCDECVGPIGACCLPEGCVDEIPAYRCRMLDGVFAPDATCEQIDCERIVRGACCIDGERCFDGVRAAVCDAEGGVFYPRARCFSIPCRPADGLHARPTGTADTAAQTNRSCDAPAACCFPDGTCAVIDVIVCTDSGGVPLDGNDDCATCRAFGACCLPNGGCVEIDVTTCTLVAGEWRGADTSCTDGCGHPPREPALWRYATHLELGLVADDDIDAMIVFDQDMDGLFGEHDRVLFSLTRGSPSLATIEGASAVGAAADVFFVKPGAAPRLFAPGRAFGLGLPVDDIDALELVGEDETAAMHAIRNCPAE
jgi:hypothetical protein